MLKTDKRSRVETLADAANAREEARRFRRIAIELGDSLLHETLVERALELETVAIALESAARMSTPS